MDSKKRLVFLGIWGATFMVQFGETIPQSFLPLFSPPPMEELGISAAVFAHAFCHWGLPTFIPLFAAGLGYNEAVIGLALTANALVTTVTLPIVGGLSNRVGRFPDFDRPPPKRLRLRPRPQRHRPLDAHRANRPDRLLCGPRVPRQPGGDDRVPPRCG